MLKSGKSYFALDKPKDKNGLFGYDTKRTFTYDVDGSGWKAVVDIAVFIKVSAPEGFHLTSRKSFRVPRPSGRGIFTGAQVCPSAETGRRIMRQLQPDKISEGGQKLKYEQR